jgi:hypothetical protein
MSVKGVLKELKFLTAVLKLVQVSFTSDGTFQQQKLCVALLPFLFEPAIGMCIDFSVAKTSILAIISFFLF